MRRSFVGILVILIGFSILIWRAKVGVVYQVSFYEGCQELTVTSTGKVWVSGDGLDIQGQKVHAQPVAMNTDQVSELEEVVFLSRKDDSEVFAQHSTQRKIYSRKSEPLIEFFAGGFVKTGTVLDEVSEALKSQGKSNFAYMVEEQKYSCRKTTLDSWSPAVGIKGFNGHILEISILELPSGVATILSSL